MLSCSVLSRLSPLTAAIHISFTFPVKPNFRTNASDAIDASLPSSIRALGVIVLPLASWTCTATTPRATPVFPYFQVLMLMRFSGSNMVASSWISLRWFTLGLASSWRSRWCDLAHSLTPQTLSSAKSEAMALLQAVKTQFMFSHQLIVLGKISLSKSWRILGWSPDKSHKQRWIWPLRYISFLVFLNLKLLFLLCRRPVSLPYR